MTRYSNWLFMLSLLGGSIAAQELSVTLDTGGEAWVQKDSAIVLVPSRWPSPDEGRLAVLIGHTDSTDLFRKEASRLVYRPELLSLSPGESEIQVFLVAPRGEWSEIARLPLQVLRRGGIEQLQQQASVDLELLGIYDPGDAPEIEESTLAQATGQANYSLTVSRSGWEVGVMGGIVAATEEEQALRFSEQGASAPKVDLASYQVSIRRGRGVAEVGAVTIGSSRQLLESFISRGVHLGLPIGSRLQLGLSAVNGTQVAGWDNFFGLAESAHRLYAGSIDLEILERPGAMKLSGTVIDANIMPLSDFNQVFLEDREQSSGWSANLEASTPGGRIRFLGGFARSTFDNPEDPFLSQGSDLVDVVEETKNARYVDLDFVLYQGSMREDAWSTTVSLGLHHVKVDPLYRSIGTWVTPDTEENRVDLTAMLGPMTGQASYRQSEDNLDDIASVLKTKSNEATANLFIPLAQTLPKEGGEERRWLPVFTYGYLHMHQYGDSLPVNGGFDPSHVPDQVSLAHQGSFDWQGNRWRVSYRLGISDQDNRQIGRERDDFEGTNHGLSLGLSPHHKVDLTFDVSNDVLKNRALLEDDQTQRYGFQLNWRWTDRMSLDAIGSRSQSENDPKTREATSTDLSLQWFWRFDRMGETHGFSGQLYFLYARQMIESISLDFDFSDRIESWRLSSGLSFSFH